MIVKTIVENTCSDPRLATEHGLSLYLQTNKHNILFDTGQGRLFLDNAKLMDIAMDDVDTVVISHGHYDHGGGLQIFFQHNKHAGIFIHKHAFTRFWSQDNQGGLHPIGLNPDLADSQRLTLVDDYWRIDEELELFAGVRERVLFSPANDSLLRGFPGKLAPDDFSHEQSLIINSAQGSLLLAGCAHNGVVNIIERFIELKGTAPSLVVGGFHLMGGPELHPQLDKLVAKLADRLRQYPTRFYTNHCTGQRAYAILKNIMGEQINYLAAGDSIELL